MTKVLILGAGGTGRDIVDWLPELAAAKRALDIVGFLDDDPKKEGTKIAGVPVVGTFADLAKQGDVKLIDALGSPRSFRERSARVAGIPDERWLTVIHPLARVSASAKIGTGSLLYPFTFVGPDVVIGRHVTVLSHGAINHDARIGEFAILASHVSLGGNVTIGAGSYVGMRAAVREGVAVGAGAMIGMGAVVTAPVAAGTTVVGVPARSR
jgi:sugar O-acyltransferase (sialic acid O-acetyltransferase NeuD family)